MKFDDEGEDEEDEGGAIVKPILKKKKKDPKIKEALDVQAAQMGGAIKDPKLKKKKTDPKIKEALEAQAAQMGGKLFYSPTHKYLHEKLSGRGGRLDTAFCREKMHQLMSRSPPSFFQAYLAGKVNEPTPNYHERSHPNPRTQPKPRRPTLVDTGGSLKGISHSENGLLQAFDSTFHHFLQLV